MSRQSRETKFNPFWFYKLLVKPSRVAGEVIPELVMPSGDEVWSADDGQKMKWRDSWRSCWETLLKEFLPHAQSRSEVRYNKKHPQGFMSPTLMIAYEPSSGHDWLRSIDDSQMTKSHAQSLNDHNVLNYRFVNDVFGWALDCTLKYCRWRMGWGEWSKRKRGKYEDVADTYFFSRPRSQRACKFLVNWIVKFANARQQFYLHIDGKIRHPCHSQSRVCKSTKEIITHHKGRPAKLKMGKTPNEDLWLILIWPIAVQHGWTYKDVVRPAFRPRCIETPRSEADTSTSRQRDCELFSTSTSGATRQRIRAESRGKMAARSLKGDCRRRREDASSVQAIGTCKIESTP